MASLIELFDEPLLPRTLSGVRSWPIAALRQRPLWVDSGLWEEGESDYGGRIVVGRAPGWGC